MNEHNFTNVIHILTPILSVKSSLEKLPKSDFSQRPFYKMSFYVVKHSTPKIIFWYKLDCLNILRTRKNSSHFLHWKISDVWAPQKMRILLLYQIVAMWNGSKTFIKTIVFLFFFVLSFLFFILFRCWEKRWYELPHMTIK